MRNLWSLQFHLRERISQRRILHGRIFFPPSVRNTTRVRAGTCLILQHDCDEWPGVIMVHTHVHATHTAHP